MEKKWNPERGFETHEEFLQFVFDDLWMLAQESLLNGEEITPSVIIIDFKHGLAHIPMELAPSKDAFYDGVNAVTGTLKPDAVIFLTEAWALNTKTMNKEKADAELEKYGSVSQHPDRFDILAIVLHRADGKPTKYRQAAVIKSDGAPASLIDEKTWEDNGTYETKSRILAWTKEDKKDAH